MCRDRDLNRRSASAVAGLDHGIIGTDTLLRACPLGAQCIATGNKTISPSSQGELSVRNPLPRHVFLFFFIFIHNMLVQTLHFVKAHRRPPCSPSQKKTGGSSSPFSGGKNCGVGFRSQRAGAGSEEKGRR